jgi:hypothetical protein
VLTLLFFSSEFIVENDIQDVYVLCTEGELKQYRVSNYLSELCKRNVSVHHHPFMDGLIPQIDDLLCMIKEMRKDLENGHKILIQ